MLEMGSGSVVKEHLGPMEKLWMIWHERESGFHISLSMGPV
jgi:hypothetical protein